MEGFPYVHRERVALRDMDAFRHLNNVALVAFLETARVRFFETVIGFAAPTDLPIILASVNVEFRGQAGYGDDIEIGVRTGRIGGKSFDLEYRAERAGGELVAEAGSVLVCYSFEEQRTIEVPDAWRERFAAFGDA
jgi:acyl-CoA thioester hydrolase